MWKPSSAVLVAGVLLNGVAHADSGWATRSELGFVMTRGNTNTDSGNFKFDTAHAIGRWKYMFGVGALYGRSNNISTAERWDGHFQTDATLDDRMFWFGALRYEDDRFSGFAYQESFSTGLGYDFIKTDSTRLRGQLGAGARRLRPEELVKDPVSGAVLQRIPQDTRTDAVGNAAVTFEHAFSPSTKVINSLLVESGRSNTSTRDNLSLQVRMNASLALAVGFQVHFNSNPPPGAAVRTDKLTTINLVYELKNPNFGPTASAHQLPGGGSSTTASAASK
jgi:putative salt-induced outer membrane protein